MSADQPTQILFRNGMIVDGSGPDPVGPYEVLVEGDKIKELSERPIRHNVDAAFDLNGRTLMPGLIDCHAHPCITQNELEGEPPTLMTARASQVLKSMLARGFTTIRDAAGSDWGLKQAVEEGVIVGPRLFISGRAISQTGGHGDMRRRTDDSIRCGCADVLQYAARIADGVDNVRHAARDELRKGADQIKVMASGGVISPNDPLENYQFSLGELRAIVEEAAAWKTYVMAHAYTAEAITRALESGVRSIEHANLIDESAANLVVKKSAYVVPTLVAYGDTPEELREQGFSDGVIDKTRIVQEAGLRSIEICRRVGAPMGFGTDLIGGAHNRQSTEFKMRAEVQPTHEVIASATRINARILRQEGVIGTIAAGALADLIVVDGDPLADIELLQGQGERLVAIMKNGQFFKNELSFG